MLETVEKISTSYKEIMVLISSQEPLITCKDEQRIANVGPQEWRRNKHTLTELLPWFLCTLTTPGQKNFAHRVKSLLKAKWMDLEGQKRIASKNTGDLKEEFTAGQSKLWKFCSFERKRAGAGWE